MSPIPPSQPFISLSLPKTLTEQGSWGLCSPRTRLFCYEARGSLAPLQRLCLPSSLRQQPRNRLLMAFPVEGTWGPQGQKSSSEAKNRTKVENAFSGVLATVRGSGCFWCCPWISLWRACWLHVRVSETAPLGIAGKGFSLSVTFIVIVVVQSCLTLYDLMDYSTQASLSFTVFLQFTQTRVHRVGNAIQPSLPLSSPSPPALSLSQHQDLFQ